MDERPPQASAGELGLPREEALPGRIGAVISSPLSQPTRKG